MIPFDQAYATMMRSAKALPIETTPLAESVGRVLAKTIYSDIDMPPFNKSAMDGFACRREDLEQNLTQIELIPAGKWPEKPLGPGECARIMTGAPLPHGADCVFILEESETLADGSIRFTGKHTPSNFCLKGEDIQNGSDVLPAGTLLRPAHLAVLATVGQTSVPVYQRPRVGMIATGSELVSPNTSPQHAQIRNSNSSQLCAQIRAIGAIATDYGVAHDTFEATCALITQAKEANHVVVLSGGASSGDFDFVPASLRHCGFQLDFDSIAMQPGRPTLFGHQTASWCFGLPGNPVSTFVIFESMLVPFLYQLMGHTYQPRIVELELVETIRRRRANRQSTLPVRLVSPSKIAPIDYHGSAHIHAMTQADALITLPIDCYEIQAGTKVHARLL